MKSFEAITIRHRGGRLEALDQTLLPQAEVWVDVTEPAQLIEAIQALRIRGAPLIGVAAALGFAKVAEAGANTGALKTWGEKIRSARPTAVNLMNAMDRVLSRVTDGPASVVREAEAVFDEDVALCEKLAQHGSALIQDGDAILTHCNAGALATAGVGTAVGAVIRAHEQGKRIHVFVDETRPLLQGGRLTTWELRRAGVPYTLICDNMAASLMRAGRVKKIFVGADRVAVNGDFANKIGTYGLAVLARHHGVEMYPVAPVTTVDPQCRNGSEIEIEERNAAEVRGVSGKFGQVMWAPTDAPVFNPAFDVTPVDLVTALVTDFGVFSRADLQAGRLATALKGGRL